MMIIGTVAEMVAIIKQVREGLMSIKKVMRVLWCKKAAVKPSSGTLQHLMGAALKSKEFVGDRLESTSADPTTGGFRLIAQHYAIGGGIAGIFTSYELGASAVSIESDPGAKQLNIAQLQPPKTSDGKRREWAEGLLYFYVRGDYVVMIQSSAVRQGQLEEHLSWLLKKTTERIGPAVELANQPTKSARDLVKRSHVRAVNFGGSLMRPKSEENATGPRRHQFKVVGPMLDAMKEVLKAGDESFKWEDGLDGNIEAWLHLTYKRSTNESAQRLLDKIGLALRNVEGVTTELELGNGEKISDDELKLTTKRQIEAEDGVLIADSAFTAMRSWLIDIVDSGDIG